MGNEPITIVSADGHGGGPIGVYREYLDAHAPGAFDVLVDENERYVNAARKLTALRPEVLDAVDDRGAIRGGGIDATLETRTRLEQLDDEGIAAEVVLAGSQAAIPPFFSGANDVHPPELRDIGVRAYHRWMADSIADSDGRIIGVADPGSCRDMDAAVDELRWAAEHGFKSIGVPGAIADPELPPVHDAYYEPFWSACADSGLVLSLHAGWGFPQGVVIKFFEHMASLGDFDLERMAAERLSDSPMQLDLGPRRAMWQLMLAGVFDRHPSLKLVLTEMRADWVPATVAHLDARFERGDTPLKMKPSEYFERHCAVAPSSPHRAEVEMRHEIGVHKFLFGVDYPHTEGTWPNARDWIRVAFEGVPEEEVRQIMGENAIDIYGLDRAKLTEIAKRIGPKPADLLLGANDVDPRKIDHFDTRAGYRRPAEEVNTEAIDHAFAEDLALVGNASTPL